jgi:two-component system response regulator FlrC
MLASHVELVGNHPKFLKNLDFAKNVAVTKAPVLTVGESGTGKKAFCHFIHTNSARKDSPLIFIECAADATEVENQVLGYRDDATGSFVKGALERANGGSVVFANIDALDEKFQKRLYTIIQELSDYEIDVRVMATTSKNLSKFVGAGRFYRALYTLFSTSVITLLPLRERGTDAELIANHLLNEIAQSNSLSELKLTSDASQKIASYYWTHNVAELKSVLENAAAGQTDNLIDVSAIELGEKKAESAVYDYDEDGMKLMSLRDAERLLIKKALIHTSENRTQAAKILGVSIRTLRNKINEYRTEGNSYFVNLR